MQKKKPVALARGGTSWDGWHFGPYGKAREYRLIDPAGTTYTAGEIQELARLAVELDYLRNQAQTLRGQVDARACHFSPDDVAALQIAIAILGRVLPAVRSRTWRGVTPPRTRVTANPGSTTTTDQPRRSRPTATDS
ncbi:MAG TPA: hypothetical protein VJ437_13070 [Acidiferrobacterales bacterium]|nr:hypothetical protein [Acidiferrobacterales bacterium]